MKIKTRQKIRFSLCLFSLLCFPITLNYFSPYLSFEGATKGLISGSLLVFIITFSLSLFLGRAGCGWLCPVGGLQDACTLATGKKAKNKNNWIRYIIWIPWLLGIIYFLVRSKHPLVIDFFYKNESGYSLAEYHNYVIFYSIYFIVLVLVFTVGNRSFCHHACWINLFMVIARRIRNTFKWPALQFVVSTVKCINCKKCNDKCPQSLDVNGMVQKNRLESYECIMCGQCADNCPKDVINYVFR